MRVGILLITHRHLGQEIINIAAHILGLCPLKTSSLEVYDGDDLDKVVRQAIEMVDDLDSGAGVLILTDAYGSTPGNIAVSAARNRTAQVVSGVNLPMLLRIFNYYEHSLAELAETAVNGGRTGIFKPGPEELSG